MLIVGSAPSNPAEIKTLAENNLVISVNGSYKLYNLKPDVIVWQDRHCGYAKKFVTPAIVKNEQGYLWDCEEWEAYHRTKTPDFSKSNTLCFYPYTGVAALQWAIKQNPEVISIAGYSFEENHNSANGQLFTREKNTNNVYMHNIGILTGQAEDRGILIEWIMPKG